MTWTLDIPVRIPSGNEIKRRLYAGKRGWYKRLRKDFAWAIAVEAAPKNIPRATKPRRVLITRIIGPRQKRYDGDNLSFGAKALVDELVTHGLLRDDSERWATIEYAQERGAEAGARVEITE